MLPAVTRCGEHLYTVPKFDLGKGDIKDFACPRVGLEDNRMQTQTPGGIAVFFHTTNSL